MTVKSRREKEREDFVNLIIDSAEKLIETLGREDVSIRKIAADIQYSPSIIYHYFKDKTEIMNAVMMKKYRQMDQRLTQVSEAIKDPIERFRAALKTYILGSLAYEKDYVDVMLNEHPDMLKHTAVLFENVAEIKPGFKLMTKNIQSIKNCSFEYAQQIAQTIWISTYGLITRFKIEKVDENYRSKLIEAHLDYHMTILKSR